MFMRNQQQNLLIVVLFSVSSTLSICFEKQITNIENPISVRLQLCTVQQLWVSRLPGCRQPWTSPHSGQSLPSAGVLLCYHSDTKGKMDGQLMRQKAWILMTFLPPGAASSVHPYRVKDGTQYDLVGAALQDDLNVSLQKTGFGEEFGLCCECLWCLCTIRFSLKRGTLGRRKTHINTIIPMPQSIGILQTLGNMCPKPSQEEHTSSLPQLPVVNQCL